MSDIKDLIEQLEQTLPALRAARERNALANDIFEGVEDLLSLALHIRNRNTMVDYRERVRQERELWDELRRRVSEGSVEDLQRYRSAFDAAEQVLGIAAGIEMPKDGHLAFLRIAREQFAFVQNEYNFTIVREEPARIRFSSGRVYLELAAAKNLSSSCSFGSESDPDQMFWIDDLLYMKGDRRYRSLTQELQLDDQRAIQAWFGFLADIFRLYGDDILSARPGIFEDLRAAQAARDREYVADIERRPFETDR